MHPLAMRLPEPEVVPDGQQPTPHESRPLPATRQQIYDRLWSCVVERLKVDLIPSAVMRKNTSGWAWDARVLESGNHYDPVYTRLLAHLEQKGEISPERSILVETTTGSAGASFARIAAELGYQALVFVPRDLPGARIGAIQREIRKMEGSEVRFSEPGKYVGGLVRELGRFLVTTRETGFLGKDVYAVDHSRRPEAVDAIEEVGGLILDMLPEDVTIGCATLALGNGTSFTGLGRALRRRFPECRLVGVEPQEAAWFYYKKHGEAEYRRHFHTAPGHRSHGLLGTGGWGVEFPNMDLDMLDQIYPVAANEWKYTLREMRHHGCDVGHSTAACIAAANSQFDMRGEPPSVYFTVYYDSIFRYDD